MLIDIEVVNTQLDYNLLLGCSYMYAMRVLYRLSTLDVPHDGDIVTINQLT